MSTAAASGLQLSGERRFFLGMAAALAICTFAGFARSYYFMSYTGAASLAALVHLHGALFTAWVLLFGIQVSLISPPRRHPCRHGCNGRGARRRDDHTRHRGGNNAVAAAP